MKQVTYYCDVCATAFDGDEQKPNAAVYNLAAVEVRFETTGGLESAPRTRALSDVCRMCRWKLDGLIDRWIDAKGELPK